ncbi:hypothetical protein LIER_27330 [Lithospermum erythrorhizon]|uniref:SUZ domain-containing protein n=1 Tax=Lithospermum erythrorhizon TaxID=34254 RepID=A0AAV3RD97_LITER
MGSLSLAQFSKEVEAAGMCYMSMVDPFLVEALQNPRHRLTILRMELDIQKFLESSAQQFEFQHFPTSYLRLAAHRVAQHYGLQTSVQDNVVDGLGICILVRKKADTKFPAVRLSDIPVNQPENEKHEQIKIVLKQRPNTSSSNSEMGLKRNSIRTVEERKEDYEKARARIFNNCPSSELEDTLTRTASDGKDMCLSADENDGYGMSSRVAILRDMEKDRSDPDYDRSSVRYVRNIPSPQSFTLTPFNVQKFEGPYVQYDNVFPQPGQMPTPQVPPVNYRGPIMNPYGAMGFNQAPREAVYMQWPMQTMMYAQSYDQLRHAVFQAPFCQQPLSFNYTQNHS